VIVAAAVACETCGLDTEEVAWSEQLRRYVCFDCYRHDAPDAGFADTDWVVMRLERQWRAERKREDARRAALALDEIAACERIVERARSRGLRAMVDPVLAIVVTECDCGHGGDPNWLPLQIVPRWQATVYRCACCGFEQTDARR
jgi:hypothetical protein